MIAAILGAVLSLADVERAAVEHAPQVAQARAVVAERAALLDAARAGGFPQAFVSYAQAPQGGLTGTIAQRLTTAGAQFSTGDLAARSPQIAQAAFDAQAARADELSAERAERLRAAGLYFDALRADGILGLRTTIVRSAQADVQAAEVRFAAGDAPQLDVVRADVAYAQEQAALSGAQAADADARHALAVEIGSPDDALVLPQLASLPMAANVPASTQAAVATALQRRPEVAAARAQVASEQAAVRVAQRALLPGVSAQIGWTRGVDSNVAVSGPSASLTLNVPLTGANADRATAERARLDQARAQLDAQTQAIDVEVSAALRDYLASVDAAAAASRASAEALAEVRATQIGYRDGASSSLDLEDARRTYAQAAIDATIVAAAVRQAAATLAITMGSTL